MSNDDYSLASDTDPEDWLRCPECSSDAVEKTDQWFYGQTYECQDCGSRMAWGV